MICQGVKVFDVAIPMAEVAPSYETSRRTPHLSSAGEGVMSKLYVFGMLALSSCIEPTGRGCHARALVTFVSDDGSVTDYTVKKPIFDAHRAVAVSALISTRQ